MIASIISRERGIWKETQETSAIGSSGDLAGTEPAAVSAAIRNWAEFVRQITYHLRTSLMKGDDGEPGSTDADPSPAMPRLQLDGTLLKQ